MRPGPILSTSKSFPPFLRALEHRNYRLFFFGQFVSLIGTWMQTVAQGWLVLRLTNSALSLGVVAAATALPIVCFSISAGMLADRVSKRRVILITQCIALVLSFVCAALTLTHQIQFWHLVVLAFFLGTANAYEAPARQAFAVELAGRESLSNAIALNSFIFNGSRMIGPAIAGFLVSWFGEGIVFAINGLSFLALILALLKMDLVEIPFQGGSDRNHFVSEALEYLKREPAISALLGLAASLSVFGFSYSPLLPLFVRDVLHADARGLGMLSGASGVGAVIGALTIAFVGVRLQRWPWICASAAIFPLTLLILSYLTDLHWAMFANAALGWSGVTSMVLTNSRIQGRVPDHLRARILSFYTLSILGLGPAGSIVLGWLVGHVGGIGHMFFISSCVALVSIGFLTIVLAKQPEREAA